MFCAGCVIKLNSLSIILLYSIQHMNTTHIVASSSFASTIRCLLLSGIVVVVEATLCTSGRQFNDSRLNQHEAKNITSTKKWIAVKHNSHRIIRTGIIYFNWNGTILYCRSVCSQLAKIKHLPHIYSHHLKWFSSSTRLTSINNIDFSESTLFLVIRISFPIKHQ